MFKKKTFTVVIILSLVLAASIMLSACNKDESSPEQTTGAPVTTDESAEDATETEAPIVQLDVFSASTAAVSAAGVYDNTWWGKILIDKIGVSLNILPSGDQATEKLQALMAGGELPDIVIFNTTKNLQNAIRGEMLVNLDDYMAQLPNVAGNIPKALQYYRDNISNDTGNVYGIPSGVGPANLGVEPNWGPYLRWDLYTEAGSPAVATYDDYLSALKAMQDIQPTTEDGKNVYGITLWKDWDSYSMFMATELSPTLGTDCGDQLSQLPYLQVDFTTGETKNTLDKDSEYIHALSFYFQANQMGLLDPDSLTQTYDTAKSKITEGRVLFSWWSWLNDAYNTTNNTDADEPTGFAAVLPENAKIMIAGDNNIGGDNPIAIGAATENLDACLKYVDFMYSADGLQELYNGPEGVTWTLDSSNKAVLTEEAWTYINDLTLDLPSGGKFGDGTRLLGFNGLSLAFINPATEEPIEYKLWSSTKEYVAENQTKLQKDWSSVYDYQNTIDYIKGESMVVEIPLAKSLITPMTDDISTTASRIGDIVTEYSWKMVFAQDEAEFDSLYEEMKVKAEGLGLQDVYESSLAGWNEALANAASYE